jgi:hypothetical protein
MIAAPSMQMNRHGAVVHGVGRDRASKAYGEAAGS